MMRFIDISNWQGGIDLPALLPNVDGVMCKATEGATFVDPYCDGWVQGCINAGKPWGFYHFAGSGDAIEEATHFIQNTINYFEHGIPVLDWEGNQSVDWVNEFVAEVYSSTHVWPWIYGNPWRFNQGGVEPNCARWVAEYPAVTSPSFEQAESWECPEADGNVVAWQFCSDGRVSGYNGNLDCSLFYGTEKQWRAYALGGNPASDGGSDNPSPDSDISVLENDEYKITIERK
jgi:GH25 family lysozyme M1 (1,4-beta-N-acetylmuramidase)